MTNCVTEIKDADVIFITGSNTSEAHPVMGMYVRQAKRMGKKIIVADPVRIPLAESCHARRSHFQSLQKSVITAH